MRIDLTGATLMDAAGIAPAGDLFACRWIALRHARDHIHLVATLVRQDGRRPNLRNWYRRRDVCDLIESELGLAITRPAGNPRDVYSQQLVVQHCCTATPPRSPRAHRRPPRTTTVTYRVTDIFAAINNR
ncbi:hypothetical protein [Spongiactinospora sp. 9N601]|uniref:hypothetical protein n=1 Tax=Spongiactinospora sp. 9N601 TaxID=3375149 RepID=UPI00378E22BD